MKDNSPSDTLKVVATIITMVFMLILVPILGFFITPFDPYAGLGETGHAMNWGMAGIATAAIWFGASVLMPNVLFRSPLIHLASAILLMLIILIAFSAYEIHNPPPAPSF